MLWRSAIPAMSSRRWAASSAIRLEASARSGSRLCLAVSLSLAGLPDCSVMLAVAVGRAGFGVGMTRCCAAVAGVVRGEGGAGGVPGGAQVRVVRGWLGADRVIRVVVPGQFAVGADGGGLLLPGQACGGVVRDRAEGGDRPREAAGGGVLADAAPTVVHDRGELGEEAAAFGVTGCWDLGGPRGGRERDEVVAAADAGVDHGGDVPGADQVPLGDGLGEDLARVQAREFGGAQRAVQPLLLMTGLLRLGPGRERGLQQGAVPLLADGRGLARSTWRAGRPGGRRRLSAFRQAWAADCLAPSRPAMISASMLTGLVDPGSSRSTWSGPPAWAPRWS